MDHTYTWFNLGLLLGLLLFVAAMAAFLKRADEILEKEKAARRTLITTGAVGALLSSYPAAFLAVAFGGMLGGGIGAALAATLSFSCEARSIAITAGATMGIAVVFGTSLSIGAFTLMTLSVAVIKKNGTWYR